MENEANVGNEPGNEIEKECALNEVSGNEVSASEMTSGTDCAAEDPASFENPERAAKVALVTDRKSVV